MTELRTGDLCYYDSLSCLILGKAVKITKDHNGSLQVTILVTANSGHYTKGETIETTDRWAIPRKAVKRSNLGSTVRPYTVLAD